MRISGITIRDNKQLEFALADIYGIGRPRAREILQKAGVRFDKRAKELSPDEENILRKHIETHMIEGELKRQISGNIKRLKDIQCYRGIRHMKRLPVHGQRTRTNSRTVRGNVRKTMGSGKRKLEKT